MDAGLEGTTRVRGYRRTIVVALAMAISVVMASAASPASATLKEDLAPFADCPLETPGVASCVVSVTTSGEFVIGNSTVPINKTIILQGGIIPGSSQLVPAADGNTLSKTPLTVPGGLLGIELLGNLTEVTATSELAGPAELPSSGPILPLKVKLDNPLLGNACYIGSDSEPIVLNLTNGTTNPPPPNKPITGNPGTHEVRFQGQMIRATGTTLVDNAFASPAARGCGGLLSLVVDPSVNLKEGLPAAAGHNTAILNGGLALVSAELVRNPPPDFGRCVKVAKGTGNYHSANCAEGIDFGNFEWQRGVVKKGFTTAGGTAKIETANKTKVTCAAESGVGQYSGAKQVNGVTMRFTGCVGPKSAQCSTAGAGEGELVTKPLEGLLGITSEAIVSGEEERKIGFDLSPISHGGPFVEFSCGGVSMTVRGSVIVPVTADKMALSSKQTYKATGGNQVPEHFEGEPDDVLETSAGGGPFEHAGLTMKLTQTSEEPVEVNAFT